MEEAMSASLFSRRSFLSYASAFGLSAVLPVRLAPARVAVLGAGLAGLKCARTLADLGMTVVVYEARSRIGGRIWTDDVFGVPLEVGIDRFFGDDSSEQMAALMTKAGITWKPTDEGWTMVDDAGVRYTDTQITNARSAVKKALNQGLKNAEDVPTIHSIRDVIASGAQLSKILFRTLLWLDLEHPNACGMEDLSLSTPLIPATRQQVFTVSPSKLVESLAKGLDIRLQETVQSITWDDKGVDVDLEGKTERYDAVVVALPAGVLKDGKVGFNPGLPKPHQDALASLNLGHAEKLFLQFDKPHWQDGEQRFVYATGIPLTCSWFETVPGQPILVGHMAAAPAAQSLQDPQEQTVRQAMEQLRGVLGSDVPDPKAARLTKWGSDPFSLGAKCTATPGHGRTTFSRLAEPIASRVFVAGEHASKEAPGTMQGAYLSGMRAAAQASRILGA